MLEEPSMERESKTWSFLKWAHLAKVLSVILVGDPLQLRPQILSVLSTPALNELGRQLQVSLIARLLRAGFPSHKLTCQYRMHPDLSKVPSRMTYNGELTNDRTTETLTLGPGVRGSLEGLARCSKEE